MTLHQKQSKHHFLLVVALVLSHSGHEVLERADAAAVAAECTTTCRSAARRALCAYTKCVLQLDKEKDRLDSNKRVKECEDEKGESNDDFEYGDAGCLPALTLDVADKFAGTCAEGELRIVDACEWARMYVNLSCEAQKEANIELCSLPQDTGPCRADFTRWYHDNSDNQCKTFTYGGCQGNDNRFSTQAECEATCALASSVDPKNAGEPNNEPQCGDICPPQECVTPNGMKYCVDEDGRNECLKHQRDGCQNIFVMESCPVQYGCGDVKEN